MVTPAFSDRGWINEATRGFSHLYVHMHMHPALMGQSTPLWLH